MLAGNFHKLMLSPKKLVKELWFYNYQDFRLIFEQKEELHYFQVSAEIQSTLVRIGIVAILTTLLIITLLAVHSGLTVWQYKNLEASKLIAEQRSEEALAALAELSEESDLQNKNDLTQADLIKAARSYRERLDKMQMLVEYSAQELKLANQALERGLNVSGINQNLLQKIKSNLPTIRPGIGGPSEEISLEGSSDQVLQNYKVNLAKLELLKGIYKSFPSESPVNKAITTSKYGVRIHPITNKLTLHQGIDYVPTFDEYAKSTLPGVVEKAEHSDSGYGNMVVVLHANKVRTIYAHLDFISVKPNQPVSQGTILGKVGNTGYSTGRHLHYEISIENVKVNPSIITAMTKNV